MSESDTFPRPQRVSTVAVIGAGYVGLTAAACLSGLGHEVACVEADPARLALLSRGEVPIVEPGLDRLVAGGLATGRLRFCADARDAVPGASVVLLCVGTPASPTGEPDLRQLAVAARQAGAAATGPVTVAVKSTVPPGTCEAVELVCAEAAAPGAGISVVSHPEFLREGRAVEDFLHPARVVVGAGEPEAAERVTSLYPAGWPALVLDRRSAELVKYASNTFLALKISFANEIADLCDRLGADADAVLHGVGLDPRIGGHFLRPGPGFGGSCLPKDLAGLVALGDLLGAATPVARAAGQANVLAREGVLRALRAALGDLAGTTIGMLGLAFKPGTDDVRDSPALAIAAQLTEAGARVTGHDPAAGPVPGLARRASTPYAAATGADALVVATAWHEYADLDLSRIRRVMKGHAVIDAVRLLDPADVLAAGLDPYCPGRGLALSFHPVLAGPLAWGIAEVPGERRPLALAAGLESVTEAEGTG